MVSSAEHMLGKVSQRRLLSTEAKGRLSPNDSSWPCFPLPVLEESFRKALYVNMVECLSPKGVSPCHHAFLELWTLQLISYLLKLKDTYVCQPAAATPSPNSSS